MSDEKVEKIEQELKQPSQKFNERRENRRDSTRA